MVGRIINDANTFQLSLFKKKMFNLYKFLNYFRQQQAYSKENFSKSRGP